MRFIVERCDTIRPGGDLLWVEDDAIIWKAAASGVTEEGAGAFEACANYMFDRHWDEAVGYLGGFRSFSYAIDGELEVDVLVRTTFEPSIDGHLRVRLHPEHFALASVNALNVAERERLVSEGAVQPYRVLRHV